MDNNPTYHKTQVAIIGAGPTGLSMAVQLLRYGIPFIIIEKNEHTTPFSKAVVVQARTLEIFSELGHADKAVETGRVTTALNMFYKGSKRAAINIAGLGKGMSPFPFALSLEQSKTEKLLADHLIEGGQNIQWQSEFSHFETTATGVLAYYKDAAGMQHVIEAKYLVGCDGAHSLVRHQLGLAFEGDTVAKMFYVADVKLKSPVINTNELFIFLIKKGFVLFFPMEGEGHYRIVGILPDKNENDTFDFSEVAQFIKSEIVTPVQFDELRWFSTYKVHSRKAVAFMKDRIFIAGDAAHIHTPAGGQGMNTGIQDAYNLAWKLAFVINKKMSTAVLITYDTERSENAKHLLNTTDKMFDIMTGSNAFWNFVRIKIFPVVAGFVSKNTVLNKRIFPLISQTGIAYPNSALTVKSSIGKVKAGNRIPYFVFSNGKNIFEYITAPSFKLLFFGESENKVPEQIKNEQLYPVIVLSFLEIPENIFKNEKEFYILLRPDNHISYIGKDLNQYSLLLKQFFN